MDDLDFDEATKLEGKRLAAPFLLDIKDDLGSDGEFGVDDNEDQNG
jgi:hypothetical protein